MIKLLELAKKRYWVDEDKDGVNDKYDWGEGGNGTEDFEKGSPDGTPGKGKFDIDCSHLVHNVLKEKYAIDYLSTGHLRSNTHTQRGHTEGSSRGVQRGQTATFNKVISNKEG